MPGAGPLRDEPDGDILQIPNFESEPNFE